MSATDNSATEKMHALCLERIAFFMRKLKKEGYLSCWSVELECFFEDKNGKSVHVNRERMLDYLNAHTRYVVEFGNDIKDLNDNAGRSGLYAWGATPVVTGGKEGFASHILAALGIEHKVVPWFARQYELEFHPSRDIGIFAAQSVMPEFLKEIAGIDEVLTKAGPQFGYETISRSTRSYPHTLGRVATPSMHVNVSLFKQKGEEWENCFHGGETEPSALAKRCMRALVALQREGLMLHAEPDASNYCLRHKSGHMAPEYIASHNGKNEYYTVNYRGDERGKGKAAKREDFTPDPHYAHIENRAPSARSDPYLAMAMTFGALYIAVCRKQFAAWEKQSDTYSSSTKEYKKGHLAYDGALREVFGEELFTAALEHFNLPVSEQKTRRVAGVGR